MIYAHWQKHISRNDRSVEVINVFIVTQGKLYDQKYIECNNYYYIDLKNAYMYHCHFLEHEDNGMMGQFTVVKNPNNPLNNWAPISTGDGVTFFVPYK